MSHIGVFLRRKDQEETDPQGGLVAMAKTYDEIAGWYHHHIHDPNGPLKDYIPLEQDILEKSVGVKSIGFSAVMTLEEVMDVVNGEVEQAIQGINDSARIRIDDYRTNVEPKMVSFNANTQLRRTLQ